MNRWCSSFIVVFFFLSTLLLLAASVPVRAQFNERATENDTGVVPDDELTLVVGTRFVKPTDGSLTAHIQFTDKRIPRSNFNETDHCLDEQALVIAKEYFTTLGRTLGKAGYYYFVPETEIKKSLSMCLKLYNSPPNAWVENSTKIIAFGKVVPTANAPALERSVR